jgi:CheY-like chemotaxis protein
MATILVADDHLPSRDFLLMLLGYSGYDLLEARDGAEALHLALTRRPDLIITDIRMPKIGGYELARRLRADAPTARIPIIFYTGLARLGEAQQQASAVAITYILIKPCDPAAILDVVSGVLNEPASVALPPLREPLAGDEGHEDEEWYGAGFMRANGQGHFDHLTRW